MKWGRSRSESSRGRCGPGPESAGSWPGRWHLPPGSRPRGQQGRHWRVTFLHLGPQETQQLPAQSHRLASPFLLLCRGVSAQTHGPDSVLSSLDPRFTISVSPPSRIRAQAVLTQPTSVPSTLGQRVPISCTGNRSNTGGHYVSWHQQLPGSAHRLLTRDNGKTLSGVPDRFSASKSGKLASLTTSVQAEENTDYYCFSWADSLKVHGASGQRGRRQKPASPTARGSQSKVFAPPFLGSLRARNPAVCMPPDCSTAAPSVGRPSPGQDEGAADGSCPRFPGRNQQHRAGGQCRPCWVSGQ